MIVLNLTATREEQDVRQDDGADWVFRLEGRAIWRCPARWYRHDETGVEDAVDLFAARLAAALREETR